MALASNEIVQQTSLAMMHDLDNIIGRLTTQKMSLTSQVADLLSFGSTLDPDSPEMKTINRKRQMLAALEKRIDAEIQQYQNKRKMAEGLNQTSTQNVDRAIHRGFGRR